MALSYKDMGAFVGGDVRSDTVASDQFDAWTVNLVAGNTYLLEDKYSSGPLLAALSGPAGPVYWRTPQGGLVGGVQISSGTTESFYVTTSGTYQLGIKGAYNNVPTQFKIAGGVIISGGIYRVNYADMTTGATDDPFMSLYSGPVAGVNAEYIKVTSDNLNITATNPNVFIHTGSGTDAIRVLAGRNVLDGSTGSNFLTGGTGTDTFFVDNRGPSADIWSTLVNFHSGDDATIWGVKPDDFILVQDNEGAGGYTGLTGHVMAAGRPTASVTLAGYSKADLNNGRLTISYGRSGDLPGLTGSYFMQIHGN